MRVAGDGSGVRVEGSCKLNLFLRVTGKRADGYHGLETVMHEIDLGDVLEFAPAGALSLEVRGAELSAGEDNLVTRAARLLVSEMKISRGARIVLEKRVPMGGGLGGGSADAAATLLALDLLWDLRLPLPRLHELAARLGSDVNFFLEGGTALCTGRGEIVQPLPPPPRLHFALLCPPFGTSTAAVYAAFKSRLGASEPDAKLFVNRLQTGPPAALEGGCHNDLEEAALAVEPRLVPVLEAARRLGPSGAMVTGSGSTVFMPARDRKEAESLAASGDLGRHGRLVAVSSSLTTGGKS